MAASFIFDPSKGETPETVAARRRTADALAARIFGRAPQNVGEGLNALGQAWIAGTMRDEANDAQRAGQASAQQAIARLISGGKPTALPSARFGEASPEAPPPTPFGGATGGDVQSYLDAVKAAESGGNPNARNPNSTAGGLYQFTQGTWYDLIRKRPELGLTPDGRFDPQQQERAMRAFTDQNAGVLSNAGIPINPSNLYAAHFLGAGGASGVLRQPDETPMRIAVGPEVVKANPFLSNMTVGDFKNWTAKKMGGAAPAVMTGPAPQAGPIPNATPGDVAASTVPFPAPLPQADDGAELPANAQSAQGNLPPQQAGIPLESLIQAASNPWLSDGQRAIVNLMVKQRLQEQDPMRALDMEYKRAQTDKLHREATEGESGVFGNPIYGRDPESGQTVLGVIGKNGKFKKIDTGGVEVSSGVDKVDLGTQWGIINKRTGDVIGYQPKDLMGAESAKAEGKAQGAARATLPTDIQTAEQTVKEIDSLLKNEGLNSVVGPIDQFRPSWTMDARGRDALARYNQLKGRSFLQAYSMLKGGGQITEIEGTKAENAMARMDRAQSEEDFKLALTDFRDAVSTGMQKLRDKAGVLAPTTEAAPSGDWQDVGGVKIRRKQ